MILNDLFYTKVPTQWSPSVDYKLPGGIILRPADQINFSYFSGRLIAPHDTLFFISNSPDINDHREKLKWWIIFHSFLFNFSQLSFLFERGDLRTHRTESSLNRIREKNFEQPNAYPTNFDDIASCIYHPIQPTEQITYRSLYEIFISLTDEDKAFITNYLIQFQQYITIFPDYDLFNIHNKYWQVVRYITILEAIIGHPPNCECRISCKICSRNLPHRDLRQGSETKWRMKYLTDIGIEQQTRNDYVTVINAAYDNIRHPTAHIPIKPTTQYIPQETILEIYDLSRSIRELNTNVIALDNVLLLVNKVTRFLLLNKFFKLDIFPPFSPLQSMSIRGTVAI